MKRLFSCCLVLATMVVLQSCGDTSEDVLPPPGGGSSVEVLPPPGGDTPIPQTKLDEHLLCLSPADNPVLHEEVGPWDSQVDVTSFDGFALFFVAAGAKDGDGTRERPLGTIGEALARTDGEPSALFVATGTYHEDLSVPSNVQLFGGFNQESWNRDGTSESIIRNKSDSLMIQRASGEVATMIDGFTIHGAEADTDMPTIDFEPGSRVIIRHNTIYLNMASVTWKTYGDTHFGTGISGDDARSYIYHNRLLVPSKSPKTVISKGISLRGGCSFLGKNHITSMRTAISTSLLSEGVLVGNLIENGDNGISTRGEELIVRNNTIGLNRSGLHGCGYAVYMSRATTFENNLEKATRPSLLNNTIVLEGEGARGINEVAANADPQSLVGNRFVVINAGIDPMLYGDFDRRGADGIKILISTIDEVNALKDIPQIGANTVQWGENHE